MQTLTIKDIIALIQKGQTFEATAFDDSFYIKVSQYVPYCCTAIHDGGSLRPELREKIALDEYQRWYEEDPFTGNFISSMPITLIGKDSRFEYDLNRRPEECIYEEAWGKKVWKRKLSEKERATSLSKHANYYKVLHALVTKLESVFDGCVVYDIHSYNYQRWERQVPLFNTGVERVDTDRYAAILENWTSELASIQLTGIENETAVNDVFYGRGYQLEYVTNNFSNTLVLASEVKKVYCDELTGEDYPKLVRELQHKLKKAILSNANFFSQRMTNWSHVRTAMLLHKNIDGSLLKLDRELHQQLKNFELLAYVNPVNNTAERNRFFKSRFTEMPKFRYSPININPYELKQELNQLRVQDISDVSIRLLYESVVNSYFDKIDMLSTLGSRTFQYNSLRYFGRPSKTDLQNAQYLMLLPPVPNEPKSPPKIDVTEAIEIFKTSLDKYGFQCKIELSNKVISKVMVLNSRKIVRFRHGAQFTRTEVKALVEHEIGVHMVTTMNSSNQRLKVFNLGLPVNTRTQEGLAILAEYLSGNLTLMRLRKLALRVILADMMCNGANFIECFRYLTENGFSSSDEAYSMVTRIFRGGGFTKDYLYLSGFVSILRFWEADNDLSPLLVGKTSIQFYDTINEMIQREMIDKPEYSALSFKSPIENNNSEAYSYILSGLK